MSAWPMEDPELMSDYEFGLYLDGLERTRQKRAKEMDQATYQKHVQEVMRWGLGDG